MARQSKAFLLKIPNKKFERQSFPSESDILSISQVIPVIFVEAKQYYNVNPPSVFHIPSNFMEQSPFEKQTDSQLVKKFPAFYGTRRFISASTRERHLFLF